MLVKFLRERLTYTYQTWSISLPQDPIARAFTLQQTKWWRSAAWGLHSASPVRQQQWPPARKSPLCRVVAKGGIRDLWRNQPLLAQGKRHQTCQNPWCTRVTGDTHLTLPLYKTAVREKSRGFRENQKGGRQWIWVIKEGPRWWRLL